MPLNAEEIFYFTNTVLFPKLPEYLWLSAFVQFAPPSHIVPNGTIID